MGCRRSISEPTYRRIKRCKCDQELSDCESSVISNKMDDTDNPLVLKHLFQSRHLDKFLELMKDCLETDRLCELLDWEELTVSLRAKDQNMHYTSHCLKKEYDRQYDLYKLYLCLSTKYGHRYDRLTKRLTYSDEIYAEMSYYQPRIHDIKCEILESSIFSLWANVFAPRPKLSASADYDEDQIGETCLMRWNPSIGYAGRSSRSTSSHKYRRLDLTREVDSNNNPSALIARLKGLSVPIDAVCKAIEKNNSLGIEHSTYLDQTDDSLLRWVASIVLDPVDNLSEYLRNWKRDVLLTIESVPPTQDD